MGTVYLATDKKHGRKVAIKVLPPDVAAALGPDRFLREIGIAARLSHPHILPLHDSGQAAGLLYYVMPHVEGESLRSRLQREKQLPIGDALEITRQIADALGAAHAAGVIHRDIKPENILLAGYPPRDPSASPGWHALLADFGVAKAIRINGEDAVELRTDTGLPVGTVAYRSPEQAAGSRELDGRSDVYSLGCVLYEMLVGAPPDGGPTASELLEKRFAVPPPPVHTVRSEVPTWVDRVVARAMARDPLERFATAAQLREALTASSALTTDEIVSRRKRLPRASRVAWMGAGAVALALIGAALAFLPRRAENLDPKRVVVAGFENKTGDSTLASVGDIAADYIARGLAETRLLHDVYDSRAAARESGKRQGVDPAAARDLGRKIGAGTVIWGSYYRDGDSLHFESQLLDAGSGKVILSLEPAVGQLASSTKVVELLRQRVMAAFAAVFATPGFEPWSAASIPPTFESYREVLAGSDAAWRFEFGEAARHYRRAVALDSTYIGAKTGLALASAEDNDCRQTDSIARLLEPIRHRIPPADRGGLDYALARCGGDIAAALDANRAVIDAAPQSVGARIIGSVNALELFRPQEALALLKPLQPRQDELKGTARGMYWEWQKLAFHMLGDYQRELAMEADRGSALAGLGRVAEAVRVGDRKLASGPNADAQGVQCLALELRAHGHPREGRELMDKVVAWYRSQPDADPVRPDRIPCLWRQLSAFYDDGQWDAARAQYQRLARDDSASVDAWAGLGALAARRGDRAAVARIDKWLADRSGTWGQASYARARMAAILGDSEKAVAMLRLAFERGVNARMYIHIDPDLESLRDYPPYQELMRPKDESE